MIISDEWEVYLHYQQSSHNPSKFKFIIDKDNLNKCLLLVLSLLRIGLRIVRKMNFLQLKFYQDFIKKLVTFKTYIKRSIN